MARTNRHSKRQRLKAKRKAKRKQARKNGNGIKAGSIAIHSRLPGIEGTLIGSMDVVVDAQRTEQHPALINVAIHQRTEKRAIIWSLETGFGGHSPRVGFKVIRDGPLDNLPPVSWFPAIESVAVVDVINVDASADQAEKPPGATTKTEPPPPSPRER